MDQFLLVVEVVLRGLFLGMLYALLASGLSMVFGVMRVVNFAHGEFLMLGGFLAYFLWSLGHVNPLLTIVIVMPVMFVAGMVVQRLLVERVVGKPVLSSLLLTFGISIVLMNLAQYFFTTNLRGIPYMGEPAQLLGASYARYTLLSFGIGGVLGTVLFSFLRFTSWGKAIRATSQNAEVAMACGIDVRRVRMVSFAVGAALAGAAGVLAAITSAVYPAIGSIIILRAFAVVVLGGLGSIGGALLGALLIGVAESAGTFYLSAEVGQIIAFVVLIMVLLVRPAGIFGARVEA
ncbi:MAG: branched-chain amino acid ABC transporter permease [Chloroflexi bacterium]|nr:branched-chain amino acid ABC transporter permease [Chloroflexota bacterium]